MPNGSLSSVAVGLTLLLLSAPAFAQVDARMLRHPDVSATHVSFVYAGDVWVVPKEGGTAHRLSSPAGEEAYPRFSPDGETLAFTANYDGNDDVYTLPARGGSVTRLTHHPANDRVLDWTPDGDVLFASTMMSGRKRYDQFFRVGAEGGMPERLPIAHGEYGALSPDGTWLAFTEHGLQTSWKRYRGGAAPDVFVFNLETEEARNVTASDANEAYPMWHGRTLYFLADRGPNMRYNIWAYDLDTEELRQVTDFADVDVHTPSIGPSDLVFEAGGRLHVMDLADESVEAIDVNVVTDRATLRRRTEEAAPYIRDATVSPAGQRVIFEARGELLSLPAEHGVVRTLTHTAGAAERYPVWSPDGEHVAYWTDRNDEWQLAIRPADGSGEEQLVTEAAPGYRYPVAWSPDGDRLAFYDETRTLYVVDRSSGEQTEVDQDRWLFHGGLRSEPVSWSPDGRWLAYDQYLDNTREAVFLFDTESGERHQVTSGFYSTHRPVFDPEGQYLYVLTDRSLSPSYSALQPTWIYANPTRIAAIALRADVPSPLAPRNDEATSAAEADEEDEDENENGENGGDDDSATEIDLDDLERRMVVLPPEAGNYTDLQAVKGKVVYRRLPRTGAADEASPVIFYDLEAREETTVLGDADIAQVTANGKKLLVSSGPRYAIVDLAPDQSIDEPVALDGLTVTVDPKQEWEQIFDESWRLYRDLFYDPNLHQVDWDRMREQYGVLLDDAVTRWDVNFVIGELIGEVNASHTYRGGGDTEPEKQRDVGLLGVEWSLENGAYRIARVLEGAPWDDADVRSPLAAPGVDVEEGDYVLAVNGVPLDPEQDPWAAFAGLAGTTVELRVNEEPTIDGARRVLVEMLDGGETARLQYLDWVNQTREHVAAATDGRVGYIYVPNTAGQGQTELVRQFVAQIDKEGLIIDERFNSGGQLGDRFMELLDRRMYSYIATRHGPPQPWPPVAHTGPQVMLINGWSGSGGDAFPWYFAQADRGPIVGTRTWGGLIGPAIGHRLVDNGSVVVPPGRLYGPDGAWFAEGHGVDPDVHVPEDPTALTPSRDPQLQRAIEEVERLLDAQPVSAPARPPFEDRSRSTDAPHER